jgi:pilus assembly protein CpaE
VEDDALGGNSTILLAGVEPAVEAALRAALPDALVTVLPDLAAGKEEARVLRAAVAVVAIGPERETSFRLVNSLATAGTRVVVVGPTKDPDLILGAMREGAREYLVAGETEKLVEAIREQARPPQPEGRGSVLAVFPARGGVGVTSVATNLAGVLARNGERVCLLDLDLSMGDALAFLDLSGGYAISDVVPNMHRIDRSLLDASVLRHRSGVRVLAQTDKLEEASRIDPAGLGSLVHFLRQHYKAIVLDGLRTFDDHAVAALDACDRVLLVVPQEVPAVRRAQRCVSFLRRLGHDDARLRLVVNRYSRGAEVKNQLLADTVGLPVAATIASDYPALIRAINRGSLIVQEAPRSQLAKDIEALASLVGSPQPGASGKRSLLRRFFGQKALDVT